MITEQTKPSTFLVEMYGDCVSFNFKEEAEDFEAAANALIAKYDQADANIQQRVKNYFAFQSYPEDVPDDEFKWNLIDDADAVNEILNGKRYAAGEFSGIKFLSTLEEVKKELDERVDDQYFAARDFSEGFDVIDLETNDRFDIKLHVELVRR